jgi:hypothetical protein
MQSLFSESGKAGVIVNLGIYCSHKKSLVGRLTLDLRLQIFILLKFSNIYTTQVNRINLEIVRSREPRTTDHAAQEPMNFCHLHSLERHGSNAELPESVPGNIKSR